MNARPYVGAHMSIAGGIDCAVDRAVALDCEVLQVFTHNQRQWTIPPLSPAVVDRFRSALRRAPLMGAVAHASYLINLASPERHKWSRSVRMLIAEMERAAVLGLAGVVLHPGSAVGRPRRDAIRRVVRALRQVLREMNGGPPYLWIENAAGQGDTLGADLHEWWTLIEVIGDERIGGCLDTCHLLAAGYPIHTRAGYETVMAFLEERQAIERVRIVHMNDSARPAGARVDRHAHIGRGHIGFQGFRCWMTDPRWHHAWMIIETPKDPAGRWDRRNIRVLKSLRGDGMHT